ncbi:MAG: hypothetical protein U0797_12060 [Gemmataceae bacterium]
MAREPASRLILTGFVLLALAGLWLGTASRPPAASLPGPAAAGPYPMPPELAGVDLLRQTDAVAYSKSAGCVHCHQGVRDPHFKDTLRLGCCDCHGGDPTAADKHQAHVQPRFPDAWRSSANPVRSYTLLNHERPDFIRFVNPGDLRIAHISCGTANCHPKEVLQVRKSMMTHGCMLWGAALYNNGAVPLKRALYGEAYSMHGAPLALQTVPPPSEWEQAKKGVLKRLDPLPRFEITQPGNILRIFERGGKFRAETGIPEVFEEPGRPILSRLSIRGLGTQNRVDPTFTGLQKTRLLDPTLNFLGTNDHPGDYRSSGCTACHVLYANDRSRVHSGPYSAYGHKGTYHGTDPTIPKNEPGHPIAHRFAPGNGIPTSQCMVCHIHPGTTVMNSYVGFMWWDEETDGDLIYPEKQKHPTAEEYVRAQMSNPNESAVRNRLSESAFLDNLVELNKVTKHTQFADFHGHGWAFRAVFRRDRKGDYLDRQGRVLPNVDNGQLQEAMRFQHQPPRDRVAKDGVPLHLMDVHMEKGMHCVDCHFVQDMHGNTKLQQEVRAAVEIQCIDCHGTVDKKATLKTTGPAAYTSSKEGGRDLEALRTPWGRRRFEVRGDKVVQWSMVEKGLSWEVPQTADVVTPGHPRFNAKAALAKTVRFGADGKMEYGRLDDCKRYAHQNDNMSCIACHSSWNPSCYGCHLPQRANVKTPQLHNEGDVTRNYTSYNFQTLREDVYMLARDGDVTGNRIGPARSSCAVHVGSYNQNRESIYVQQQTISGCGLSGIAFSTNVPHTVRGRDGTKQCTDCHVSSRNDNNALMAQLLMHGTGYLNFIGRYAWVAAGDHGLEAVVVTERDEPQAVIGSTLHKLAFPENHEKHLKSDKKLLVAHEHPAKDVSEQLLKPWLKPEVRGLLARGEYLYAACGEAGVRVFDIAFIDHKGFSERVATAPVSPLGQRFYVRTKYAMAVAAPTTIAPDPTRKQFPENREQAVHPMYGSIYVADKYEGLVVIGAATLLDGNPLNNFLHRSGTFNPGGVLNGARNISIVGTYAYICCDAGLVVVSISDPNKPEIKSVVGEPLLMKPGAVEAQFRYAFVCDEDGVKVLDITNPACPRVVGRAPLTDVRGIYVARTYAYVAAGKHGLVILDVENPERPRVDQVFTAGGHINDLNDVKLGITYSSLFAYLADGKNGLRVVQLTSPEMPTNPGFSPRPQPCLIATYKLREGGKALAVSRGVDRDRAVDEAGNQIAVFGRLGARPLNLAEQQKLYLRGGAVWRVDDDPRAPLYRLRPLDGLPACPSAPGQAGSPSCDRPP